jgi:hypothetical protein
MVEGVGLCGVVAVIDASEDFIFLDGRIDTFAFIRVCSVVKALRGCTRVLLLRAEVGEPPKEMASFLKIGPIEAVKQCEKEKCREMQESSLLAISNCEPRQGLNSRTSNSFYRRFRTVIYVMDTAIKEKKIPQIRHFWFFKKICIELSLCMFREQLQIDI